MRVSVLGVVLLAAARAVAGDRIVGEVRENLHEGHDVIGTDGTVVLHGRPSLRGGELLRDPASGRLEFETRPSLDGESIRDLNTDE